MLVLNIKRHRGFLHAHAHCWEEDFGNGQETRVVSANIIQLSDCALLDDLFSQRSQVFFQKTACVFYCTGDICPVRWDELRWL